MKKILLTILSLLIIIPLSSFNMLKDVDIKSMSDGEMINYLKEKTNYIEEVVVTADKDEARHNMFLREHKNFMFGKDTIYPIKLDSIKNDTINIDSLKHHKRHHKNFNDVNDEYNNNYVRFNIFTIGWYEPYLWNDFWFYYDPFYSDFTPFNYWNYPHYYGWNYPFFYWNYPYYWNNYYYGYYSWNNNYYGHRWGNNNYFASGNMKNMSFGPKHRPIGQNFYGHRINSDHFVTNRPNRMDNMDRGRLNTEVVKRHPRMDGQMTRIRPNDDMNRSNRNYPISERTRRDNMYNNSYHRRINNGDIDRQRGNMNQRNNYVERQRNERGTYRYDRQHQDTYNRPHSRNNGGNYDNRNRNQNDNMNRGSNSGYQRQDNSSTRSSGNMNSGGNHQSSSGNNHQNSNGGQRRR